MRILNNQLQALTQVDARTEELGARLAAVKQAGAQQSFS